MFVIDTSVVTSVGIGAQMIANSVAASISRAQESSFINKDNKPMKMALVPESILPPIKKAVAKQYPDLSVRQQYMLRLCDAALRQNLVARFSTEPITLLLAGSEELFQEVVEGVGHNFLQALSQQTGLKINHSTSRIFRTGRAGVLQAIEYAFRYTQVSNDSQILVGGVDSPRDHGFLGILDAQDRIQADGVMDGYIPGEAAGFLLLGTKQSSSSSGNILRVSMPGTAEESGGLYGSGPNKGEGLSEAFRKAINGNQNKTIQKILSSMNGEHFWAKELGVAFSRNSGAFREDVEIMHPADCLGDTGAAYGAVVISLLTTQAPGKYLVYGSADGTGRAALFAEVF